MQANNIQYLLVGGYTGAIGVYNFDIQDGKLQLVLASPAIDNPSYLCFDHMGRCVYAVNEQEEGGMVYAYTFDRKTGRLTILNQQEISGSGACYVALDQASQQLFVVCYQSGSLSVFPIREDGSLGPLQQRLQNVGSSVNRERQEGPHLHAACLSPDAQYLLYTDLGTDQIHCYRYNSAAEQPLSFVSAVYVKPGSGPRHLTFAGAGNYLYVITELSGDVLVFSYRNGQLQLLQTISMLAEGFNGTAGGGDLQLSADGQYLYASNRGDANELIVFAVNQASGCLTVVQRRDCMGRSPRSLAIDPTNRYLLIANQESHNVAVFTLDRESGLTGENVFNLEASQPSCLKFS